MILNQGANLNHQNISQDQINGIEQSAIAPTQANNHIFAANQNNQAPFNAPTQANKNVQVPFNAPNISQNK